MNYHKNEVKQKNNEKLEALMSRQAHSVLSSSFGTHHVRSVPVKIVVCACLRAVPRAIMSETSSNGQPATETLSAFTCEYWRKFNHRENIG